MADVVLQIIAVKTIRVLYPRNTGKQSSRNIPSSKQGLSIYNNAWSSKYIISQKVLGYSAVSSNLTDSGLKFLKLSLFAKNVTKLSNFTKLSPKSQ